MIQLLYIINADDTEEIPLLVIFSIILTVLSLLFSFASTAVIVSNLLMGYNKHVQEIVNVAVKFTLKCDKFASRHGFIHHKLEKSVLSVLRTCERSDLWIDRSDTRLKVELFYINDSRIRSKKEIDCYFECILTLYNNSELNVANILVDEIMELSKATSKTTKSLIQSIKSEIRFGNTTRVSLRNLKILKQSSTNVQSGDQVNLSMKHHGHPSSVASVSGTGSVAIETGTPAALTAGTTTAIGSTPGSVITLSDPPAHINMNNKNGTKPSLGERYASSSHSESDDGMPYKLATEMTTNKKQLSSDAYNNEGVVTGGGFMD